MTDHEELIAAATVLLLRDAGDDIEVLMLRRNSKIAFGGMWVFPGGRVDADEMGDDVLESARTAAARETMEEAGLDIDASALVTWSHWQPPAMKDMTAGSKGPIRRFSTWFFAGDAPAGDVAIDNGEIHEHAWLTPSDAMAKHQAGEIELVPPTWLTLYQLVEHDTVAAALRWAQTTESARFWTKPLKGGAKTLVWEGDAAYESLDPTATGARNRLVLHPEGWVYEKTDG
ncbi:MAG: 8-oxo-dGTP pyrophosphatase MutT (NUDIX family) [Acidimicrobiales bacterium]